jgi:hypothetical protein
MAYYLDIRKTLADQLSRCATINRHQLAGQVANLAFWLDEVRHCPKVIDDYQSRFERMKAAEAQYTTEHKTVEFDLRDKCCIRGPVAPPKRLDDKEIKEVRRSLCDALHRFLVRCYNESFIDNATLTRILGDFDPGIEPTDLKH